MFDWAFDSLNRRVRKAEREWRKTNPIPEAYGYNLWQRRLVSMSDYPLRWMLWYLALSLLVVANAWVWWRAYHLCPSLPGFVWLNHVAEGMPHSAFGYFTAVWTIQATLAGLVYPIVISFVAILLQRRYNGKAILHIYLADSGAIPSGLSSLALVGVMGAQYLSIPVTPRSVITLVGVFDGSLFVFNVILAVTFLYRTFKFIRPDGRAQVIIQYALSVAWPEEFKKYRAAHLFEQYCNKYGAYNQTVVTTNGGALLPRGDIANGKAKTHKPRRVWLSDVRLAVLSLAVAGWRKHALKRQRGKFAAASPEFLENPPVLVLPLLPTAIASHHTPLIPYRTQQEFAPPPYADWLFRCAFVFSGVGKSSSLITASDILGDMQAEAALAIQGNETQTFKDRMFEWVELYCHLIRQAPLRTSEVTRDDPPSRVTDWNSSDVQLFWKSRISITALTSAGELAQAAVGRLDTNTEFVLALIRILGELHRRLRESLHPGAFLDYFGLLPIVFARVQAWWVTTAEQNGDVEHTPCHGVFLRPPFSGTYRLILRTFTEEWGRLQKDIFPARVGNNSARAPSRPWSVLQNGAEYLHVHMRETLTLFFGCVQRGDKEGAQRFLDVLLTWRAQIEPHDISSMIDNLPRRDWLTLEVAACRWREAEKNWAASWDPGWGEGENGDSGEPRAQEAIFWAALGNYWIDACYIAMLGLVAVGKECNCEASLAVVLLRELVCGKVPRGASNSSFKSPVPDAGEWLFSLLRFYEAYPSRGEPPLPQYSYRFRLQGLWSEIVGANDETFARKFPVLMERVRIDGLLVIFLLLDWTRTPYEDIGKLQEWVAADLNRAEVVAGDLTHMRARLNSAEFKAEYGGITECAAGLVEGGVFDERVRERGEALGGLVGKLKEITRNAIIECPISEARVQETGRYFSSSEIFTSHPRHFPVKLFGSVCAVAPGEIEGMGGVQNQSSVFSESRTVFIESYIGNPDVNDNRARMKLQFEKEVAARLFISVIEKLNPNKVHVGTPQGWWAKVKAFLEECKQARLQTLCVLAGRNLPDWLLRWAQPGGGDDAGKPGELRLWSNREWSQVDGYVGNLGDVPAFQCLSLAGQSYLLARETLDRVTFVPWEDGCFVRASVSKDQNNDMHVALKLAWRAKVDVKECSALQLETPEERVP